MKLTKDGCNILDIGSNDGTFLNFFADNKKKINLFGVDPSAKKFLKYYKKNINLLVKYFSFSVIKNFLIRNKFRKKKFSLISSFAMFYDIEDPNKFCKDMLDLDSREASEHHSSERSLGMTGCLRQYFPKPRQLALLHQVRDCQAAQRI